MRCSICQELLPSDARYCPACGAFASTAATGPTQHLHSPTMIEGDPSCPKCQHTMAPGFLPDFDDRTGSEPSLWVAGHPKRHMRTRQIMVPQNALYRVVAYRCATCGYLELYARQKVMAD